MTTNELRACPFCGHEAILVEKRDKTAEGLVSWFCTTCYAQTSNATENGNWNTRPIEDELRARIDELEGAQRWRVVADGELPEVYRDEDGDFIPFLVCEGDGGHPFRSMYNGVNWWAGIFVPDITHWMPMPTLPEQE